MSRYTDWTSGEPIEKEWAMTDPALRALERLDGIIEHARSWSAGDGMLDDLLFVRGALAANGSVCPACHHRAHEPGSCSECPRCELHTDEALAFVLRYEPSLLAPFIRAALAAAEAAPLDVELRKAAQRVVDGAYVGHFDRDDEATAYIVDADALAALRNVLDDAALRSPDTETAGEAG